MPPWTPVSSSAIVAVRYWPEQECLDVRWKSGKVYRYHGVTAEKYDGLLQAGSVGQYVNYEIKPNHGATRL